MFQNIVYLLQGPDLLFRMKEELGHAMGKEMRASLALLDAGFAKALVKQMEKVR